MKKSFIFGAALMLMGALSFQSCTKADNPSVTRVAFPRCVWVCTGGLSRFLG